MKKAIKSPPLLRNFPTHQAKTEMTTVNLAMFTEEALDFLAAIARADEELDAKTCFNCHQLVRAAPIPRCAACELAAYCGSACQKSAWPTHHQACIQFKRMRECIRERSRSTSKSTDAGYPSLLAWHARQVLRMKLIRPIACDASVMVFVHREARIVNEVRLFRTIGSKPNTPWALDCAFDSSDSEAEKEIHRNTFLVAVTCAAFVLATIKHYPSAAMCIAANSAYTPAETAMISFYKGSEWQFWTIGFDESKKPRIRFNYANGGHKSHTSRK